MGRRMLNLMQRRKGNGHGNKRKKAADRFSLECLKGGGEMLLKLKLFVVPIETEITLFKDV